MELPSRECGDILLPSGELTDIRRRLRGLAAQHDIATVIACAFDHRTRMLPFIYADMKMAPAGVRAVASEMLDAGFVKTRIVLQQWNRHFRPSRMKLDGRTPDIFMVSSMQIHSAQCYAMIRDACKMPEDRRPLIIAGGPKTIYEPWDVFSADPNDPWGADVAVTGETYITLKLLEALLEMRAEGESMRSVFLRARDSGALDDIPGLVYAKGDKADVAEALIDTGIQRLTPDLDELADPVLGYSVLEPPSGGELLGDAPLAPDRVRKFSRISSLVLTLGCKFRCPYCPIPAYNQRQFRTKSGERIAREFEGLYKAYHIRMFFGCDDNFFNDKERLLNICETIGKKIDDGNRPLSKIRWGTEATIHDTLALKDYLPMVRKIGVNGIWLGVEDMSGVLVKKGQTAGKTKEAFRLLREAGIYPMPMMMHFDEQPLLSFKNARGLLNQVHLLRRAGSIFLQVMMLTPSPGSKLYVGTYTSGLAIKNVDGVDVEPFFVDGNHVMASRARRPWVKQLNLLIAYAYFYNPLRMLWSIIFSKSRAIWRNSAKIVDQDRGRSRNIQRTIVSHLVDPIMQIGCMWGLAKTIRHTFPWGLRLAKGPIERTTQAPAARVPMSAPDGAPAAHDLPRETPPMDKNEESKESE